MSSNNIGKSERIEKIIKLIKKELGETRAAVESRDVFKVLIATVLSQRTKDENTSEAVRKLFSKYKNIRQLANAPLKQIEKLIYGSGFYKVKAKRIKNISKELLKDYKGKVPSKIEDLLKLEGVGRKTANCVLVYGYRKEAIPVDVHVFRVSNRIGLVKTKTPEKTEIELMKIIPKKYWIDYNELMVKFGQRICKPVKPLCYKCCIEKFCWYENKNLE